jgi:phosphoglucosamine mutase
VTQAVNGLAASGALEVTRTTSSLAALTQAADGDGVIFAATADGSFVVPAFQPATDAMAALCLLLELLADAKGSLSEIVAELPESHVVHSTVPCPWARKAAAMRILTESLEGEEADASDGVRVRRAGGWVHVLPDPIEPLLHLYVEGSSSEDSARLERETRAVVEEAVREEEGSGVAQISS